MKRTILAVAIVAVVAAAALVTVVPLALAGSWSVRITSISFSENTGAKRVTFGTATESTSTSTAIAYYYATRSGGSVTTANNNVNSTAGNFTGFISWFLVNPLNQTVSQGNYTFSGGFGNRTHTFIFSADQGVRNPGTYRLTLLLSGTATAAGASPTTIVSDTRYSWNVP